MHGYGVMRWPKAHTGAGAGPSQGQHLPRADEATGTHTRHAHGKEGLAAEVGSMASTAVSGEDARPGTARSHKARTQREAGKRSIWKALGVGGPASGEESSGVAGGGEARRAGEARTSATGIVAAMAAAKGPVYEGNWHQDMRHGFGVMTWLAMDTHAEKR